ncbi:MAG: tRNA glutamyl-Q(34) synthetase GluQRS [Pseudorhodobacter sp.]|nr:tRNA glutamyl-Q(34) synthetase GluQRS [Pseudorhodobacter sp.]
MAGAVTRFAPSPTGALHLGHAFAALTAFERARGGQMLLRFEDIDTARCRPGFEAAIIDDLHWLGITWPKPVLHQATRMSAYAAALARLTAMGLTYRCNCTRGDIRSALSAPQEGAAALGPDGPIYPGTCRERGPDPGDSFMALRLNMGAAMRRVGEVAFTETGPDHAGHHRLDAGFMTAGIGDIVLARRDIGTSYHLAVVIDDAWQGITEITRGADLFAATPIHVLLQRLLDLPTPSWHHHRLIRDDAGQRLAKRDDARALARYRAEGATAQDIRRMVGLK